MDYEEYVNMAERAEQAVEAGEHEQAVSIFATLVASDISDIDKAIMCQNMGVVYEKMGREEEALSSYGRGASYERTHGRSYVAEQKAGYLYRLGRLAESLRAYEDISYRSSLTEEEKLRMRHNIAALRAEISSPGEL